jgi:hypothetical protein
MFVHDLHCERCGAPFLVGLARWQVQWDGVLDCYRATLACSFQKDCRERQRNGLAAYDNEAA